MSPVLTNPAMYTVEELAIVNNTKRNPFLVESDLVVGIVLGGETRAYQYTSSTFTKSLMTPSVVYQLSYIGIGQADMLPYLREILVAEKFNSD